MQMVMSASPNYVILRHSSGHNYMNRTIDLFLLVELYCLITFVVEKKD